MSDEGCLSGHHWHGGVCSRCGEQLRCGLCGHFVTVENLDDHFRRNHPIPDLPYTASAPLKVHGAPPIPTANPFGTAALRDVIVEMRRVSDMVAALPPRPTCFMAHHAVPYGRTYRQWNTRGELLVWVNRGEIADLARYEPEYAIAPNLIDTALLASIPVVNA